MIYIFLNLLRQIILLMKGYRLKLISSDSIRVQIQKEEIDKIIKQQLIKEPKINVELNTPS